MNNNTWRGINLGGWLVLEKWITPGLFEGYQAKDETSLMLEMGDTGKETVREHHREFIVEEDFAWLAQQGINAVRIPVPYWIFGEQEPYVESIEVLDQAFRHADRYGLQVIIDLHTAMGSQNGWDHSGVIGEIGWHTNPINIAHTAEVLEKLAERYAFMDSLAGIEVLNEPHWDIPLDTLKGFYEQAYERIRAHCKESVSVWFHDSFRPKEWDDFLSREKFRNVVQDSHMYQCFGAEEKKMDMREHLNQTLEEWQPYIEHVQKSQQLVIGEWSLALDPQSLSGLNDEQIEKGMKAYAAAQFQAFSHATGWFFWTYKTQEGATGWNFRKCVEKGWLDPSKWQQKTRESVQ